MSDTANQSPDQLRTTIDALCTDAKVLLVRAQNEQMKEHVRNAQRALTDASILLDQYARSVVPPLSLAVADASIESARLRLEMVESALRSNGPGAGDLY